MLVTCPQCPRSPVYWSQSCFRHIPDPEKAKWREDVIQDVYYYGGVNVPFTECDFAGMDFKKANLSRSRLERAVLDGCNMSETVFIEADMTEASIRQANLHKANWSECKLDGADLTEAKLDRANFEGTDMKAVKCDRVDARHALLHGIVATGSSFAGANLSDAILTLADLSQCDFSGANVARADFSGANLSGANFKGALGLATVITDETTISRDVLGTA